jgi:hypothetical protein
MKHHLPLTNKPSGQLTIHRQISGHYELLNWQIQFAKHEDKRDYQLLAQPSLSLTKGKKCNAETRYWKLASLSSLV